MRWQNMPWLVLLPAVVLVAGGILVAYLFCAFFGLLHCTWVTYIFSAFLSISLGYGIWWYLKTRTPKVGAISREVLKKKSEDVPVGEVVWNFVLVGVLTLIALMLLRASSLWDKPWVAGGDLPIPIPGVIGAILLFIIWFVHEGIGFILWLLLLVGVFTNFANFIHIRDIYALLWEGAGFSRSTMEISAPPWVSVSFLLFLFLWLLITARGWRGKNGNKVATGLFFSFLAFFSFAVRMVFT